MEKILLLGPLWRNKNIIRFLSKEYQVILYNKMINPKKDITSAIEKFLTLIFFEQKILEILLSMQFFKLFNALILYTKIQDKMLP